MPADIELQLGWLSAAIEQTTSPVGIDEIVVQTDQRSTEDAETIVEVVGHPVRRHWQSLVPAAAVVMVVVAGVGWLSGRRDDGPIGVPVATTPESRSSAVNTPAESNVIVPADDLVAPTGVRVSPEMQHLLDLPTCATSAGLAAWGAAQLTWYDAIDPVSFAAADFAEVTRTIPVDTADAADVACASALASGDVRVWGLGDDRGGWLARGVGVLDPRDGFERPPQPDDRPLQGDVLGSPTLGNGQILNEFFLPTDPPLRTVAGVISFGPIVSIELREPVARNEPVDRWYHLRTSDPLPTPDVSTIAPHFSPALVPPGFQQCSDGYLRTIDGSQLTEARQARVFAVDFCDGVRQFTITASATMTGTPLVAAGRTVHLHRTTGETALRVSLEPDSAGSSQTYPPVLTVLTNDDVPVEQLIGVLLSVSVRGQGAEGEPTAEGG